MYLEMNVLQIVLLNNGNVLLDQILVNKVSLNHVKKQLLFENDQNFENFTKIRLKNYQCVNLVCGCNSSGFSYRGMST